MSPSTNRFPLAGTNQHNGNRSSSLSGNRDCSRNQTYYQNRSNKSSLPSMGLGITRPQSVPTLAVVNHALVRFWLPDADITNVLLDTLDGLGVTMARVNPSGASPVRRSLPDPTWSTVEVALTSEDLTIAWSTIRHWVGARDRRPGFVVVKRIEDQSSAARTERPSLTLVLGGAR